MPTISTEESLEESSPHGDFLRSSEAYPTRFIKISIVLALVAGLAFATIMAHLQKALDVRFDYIRSSESLLGEINNTANDLRMSADLAATTGERSWTTQYLEILPKHNRALAEAEHRVPPSITASIETSNASFLALETAAIQFVSSGLRDKALRLLKSNDYQEKKKTYDAAARQLDGAMSLSVERQHADTHRELFWLSLPIVVLLFAITLALLRLWKITGKLNRHIQRQTQGAIQAIDAEKARSTYASRMAVLGEMSAMIGHEIVNPLATIRMHAELLQTMRKRGRLEDAMVDSATRQIMNTVDTITVIVRGLRSVARDASADPFVECSVQEIISETLAISHARTKGKNIRIDVEMPYPSPVIQCRPAQVFQVILNLVANSCDAIEKLSDRWIRIRCENASPNILISVTDSGPGIGPEKRDKLFKPFFTTKGIGKGTGLGLSLSRRILREHAGDITLDTSSSNTKFVITLPIDQTAPTLRTEIQRFG